MASWDPPPRPFQGEPGLSQPPVPPSRSFLQLLKRSFNVPSIPPPKALSPPPPGPALSGGGVLAQATPSSRPPSALGAPLPSAVLLLPRAPPLFPTVLSRHSRAADVTPCRLDVTPEKYDAFEATRRTRGPPARALRCPGGVARPPSPLCSVAAGFSFQPLSACLAERSAGLRGSSSSPDSHCACAANGQRPIRGRDWEEHAGKRRKKKRHPRREAGLDYNSRRSSSPAKEGVA